MAVGPRAKHRGAEADIFEKITPKSGTAKQFKNIATIARDLEPDSYSPMAKAVATCRFSTGAQYRPSLNVQ